ncbi:MAG: DNA polymerase III subunit, partial [Parasporobacterium sp.]|nr:DNA polymerase III subunit [Parasporobacterium sp.]
CCGSKACGKVKYKMTKTFSDIIGNEDIIRQLRKSAYEKRLNHAYIFSGAVGMGKRTLAEALLLHLYCHEHDEAGDACLKCPECKKLMSGNHPDVIYVTHEKPGSISVDDIRQQLSDTVQIRPYSSHYKVYVINEAEKLTVQAQNALLKVLEEPPEYAVIILLASDHKVFLETIRSRSIVIQMRPVDDDIVRSCLLNEGVDKEKADICTAFAQGNLGRGLHLGTGESFSVLYRSLMKLLRDIRDMDSTDFRNEYKLWRSENTDLNEVLDFLRLWFRDILVLSCTGRTDGLVFAGEKRSLASMASLTDADRVYRILDYIEKSSERLGANVNPELCMELLFITIKENIE